MADSFHVARGLRYGWAVRRVGCDRARKLFQKKHRAVAYARRLARAAGGVLWIHDAGGRIAGRHDYGTVGA